MLILITVNCNDDFKKLIDVSADGKQPVTLWNFSDVWNTSLGCYSIKSRSEWQNVYVNIRK